MTRRERMRDRHGDATGRARGPRSRRTTRGGGWRRVSTGAPVAAPLLLVIVAAGTSARAQDGDAHVRARLVVERGPGAERCLDAARLAAGVERRLARDVFAETDPVDVTVTARLTRDGARFVAALTMTVERGEVAGTRTLVAERSDCRQLDDSLTLVTALLVDLPRRDIVLRLPPLASAGRERGGAPGAVDVAEPSAVRPSSGVQGAPPPSRRPRSPRRELHFDVHASAVAAGGVLPSTGVAGQLDLGVGWRALRVALGAGLFGVQREPIVAATSMSGEAAGRAARFRLLFLLPRLEFLPVRDRTVRVAVGAHCWLGLLGGAGVGFTEDAAAQDWLVAPGAHVRTTFVVLRPLVVALDAGLSVGAVRPEFGYLRADGAAVGVFRPAVVVPWVGLGVGVSME